MAVDEQLITRSPAAKVYRPRLDGDSQRLGVARVGRMGGRHQDVVLAPRTAAGQPNQ